MKAHRPGSRLQFSIGRFQRAPSPFSTMALALVMLIGVVPGCGEFEGRTRGSDAVAFAKKWLKEHGG